MAAKAMVLAKKMATKMTDALGCDMHLIPRYKGDKVGIAWEPGTLTDEMKNEILEKMNC